MEIPDAPSINLESAVKPAKPKDSEKPLFGRPLIGAYLANVMLLSSLSLLFRYADFVFARGGNDIQLGWIVGVGMVGAIIFRIVQGFLIDHLGAQIIWLMSLAFFLISLFWHTHIESVFGLEVYLARLLMVAGISGALGSWMTFVSLQAPDHRVAEVIGMIGTSGFVGMAIGPAIGDFLIQGETANVTEVNRMFYMAMGLITLSAIFAATATYGSQLPERSERGKFSFALFTRYPLTMIPVALGMGIAMVIPQSYLRPYAQSLSIEVMSTFFLTYNVTAFVFRWMFRKAPNYLGLPAMAILGLAFICISMPLYLLVNNRYMLALPAFMAGLSHTFLFPAVMALGTSKFRQQNRGVAVNMTFALGDLGILIGAPLVGMTLKVARGMQIPDYPTMFWLLAFLLATITIQFTIVTLSSKRNQTVTSNDQKQS